MNINENTSKAILRIGLSLVFLYFGIQQVLHTSQWTGFVPEFATKFFLSAGNIIMLNATLEIVLGIFLIAGIYTRASALILSIHLFMIALSIGFVPIGVRDFGLSIATFVIFLNGADKFCFDKRQNKVEFW